MEKIQRDATTTTVQFPQPNWIEFPHTHRHSDWLAHTLTHTKNISTQNNKLRDEQQQQKQLKMQQQQGERSIIALGTKTATDETRWRRNCDGGGDSVVRYVAHLTRYVLSVTSL